MTRLTDRSQFPLAVAGNGWRYATLCFGVAIVAVGVPPLALAFLALGVAILWFHRDPDRTPPASGIVAPADGRVSVLREEGDRIRVGIFMNVTDVHINRAPCETTVETVDHRPGANKPAFSKESDRNERVVIDCESCEITLIAGWFARRIHPAVTEGQSLARGQRIGHISFGSRADVLLPATYELADVEVEKGETVRAGETVVVSDHSTETGSV